MKRVKTLADDLRAEGYRVRYRNTKQGQRIISIKGDGRYGQLNEKFKSYNTTGNKFARSLLGDKPSVKQMNAQYRNYTKMINRQLDTALAGQPKEIIKAFKDLNTAISLRQTVIDNEHDYNRLITPEFANKTIETNKAIPSYNKFGTKTKRLTVRDNDELVSQVKHTTYKTLGYSSLDDTFWMISQVDTSLDEYGALLEFNDIDPMSDNTYNALTELLDYLRAHSNEINTKVYGVLHKIMYALYQVRENYNIGEFTFKKLVENPEYVKAQMLNYANVGTVIKQQLGINNTIIKLLKES